MRVDCERDACYRRACTRSLAGAPVGDCPFPSCHEILAQVTRAVVSQGVSKTCLMFCVQAVVSQEGKNKRKTCARLQACVKGALINEDHRRVARYCSRCFRRHESAVGRGTGNALGSGTTHGMTRTRYLSLSSTRYPPWRITCNVRVASSLGRRLRCRLSL
jgi:hypothetical protein